MVSSAITMILVLGAGSAADQGQRSATAEASKLEMKQAGRMILAQLSTYVRSAGSNRAGAFSAGPITTASSLALPTAAADSIRIRSDYDDDGAVGTGAPEDVSIVWDSNTKQFSFGQSTVEHVRSFVLRYYDAAGTELIPPAGGWIGSASDADASILYSILRVRIEIEMESRRANPVTGERETLALGSDVTLWNQLQ